MANKIMLIRHGEKPDDHEAVRGVAEDGSHDPTELIVRGWQRAGALVRFFAPHHGHLAHPALATPAAIFAAGPHNHHAKSVRSVRLVSPLAQFLGKSVNHAFSTGDEKQLAHEVGSLAGPVLISWEHDAIPEIAAHITSSPHLCPNRWPDSRFDLVWVLDQENNAGRSWRLTQVPQMLLPGDREEAIPLVQAA